MSGSTPSSDTSKDSAARSRCEASPATAPTIILVLPLALALLEVLLVERGGSVFGLPLASVEEAITAENVLTLEGRSALELRGRSVQLADLADLIGATAPPLAAGSPAIIVTAGGRRIAATCDRLLGQDEVVVKPLGALLASAPGYLGAAILGDGRIALLLDPRRSLARTRASPALAVRTRQRGEAASRRRSSSSRTRSPSASSSAASSRPPATASRPPATAATGSTASRPTPRSIS